MPEIRANQDVVTQITAEAEEGKQDKLLALMTGCAKSPPAAAM